MIIGFALLSKRSRIPKTGMQAAAPCIALALCMASATGCARIADPRPPLSHLPKAAADLAVHQSAADAVLTVSLPTTNTDGSPVDSLSRVDVFRIIEKSGAFPDGLSSRQFFEEAERTQSIPQERLADIMRAGRLVLHDPLPPASATQSPQFSLRYAVAFVNNRGEADSLSNQIRLQPIPELPTPQNLSATVTEDEVLLRWELPQPQGAGAKPARVAGYDIYRGERPDAIMETHLNSIPLVEARYADRCIEFEKTYYYAVRAVSSAGGSFSESAPAQSISVAVQDLFPPAPPERPAALSDGSGLLLFWTPSPSADVAGYHILRRRRGAPDFEPFLEDLLRVLSYRIPAGEDAISYEYAVEAVDARGNASAPVIFEAPM